MRALICKCYLSVVLLVALVAMPIPYAIGIGHDDTIRAYLQQTKTREATAMLVSTGLEANGRDASDVNADTIEFNEIRRLREVWQSTDDISESYLGSATQHRWGVSIAIHGEIVGVATVEESDEGPSMATFYPDMTLAQCIDSSSSNSEIIFDVPSYAMFSLQGNRLSPMNDNAQKLSDGERPVDEALREIQERKLLSASSTESGGAPVNTNKQQTDDSFTIPLALAIPAVSGAALGVIMIRKWLRKRAERSR
ncbi:hypothetical protein Uis4E_0354 [Bifidobacterium parmae]|uniref:Uncharacterized protein n=2 Tax=Bifidobacterium parmae TaxID=361854 RepID=A0A2N5J5J3_9BIFI|nr:hypothetical protein Uis4E_0354 [Bifidobacterium parmae]